MAEVEPRRVSEYQPPLKQRTALRPMHIDHGVLHWMQIVALYGTDTFHRRNMASIGREHRHQTSIDRKVPNFVNPT